MSDDPKLTLIYFWWALKSRPRRDHLLLGKTCMYRKDSDPKDAPVQQGPKNKVRDE